MIKSLNLDKTFTPTSYPSLDFKMIQFSGGELHIKLNEEIDYHNTQKVIITNRFKSADDIIKVLITKDALQRKGIRYFDLVMPYIPYARQDRQCFNGESFTLKIFTDLINSAKFDNITVLDAHSDVAPALLQNCNNLSNEIYVRRAFFSIKKNNDVDIFLVSPDSGANKKINKLFENIKDFKGVIKCDKKRDVSNGELSGFEVFTNDLKGSCCLIVDDICDGGKTFIGIAKELKNKNAGDIYLFVTHGIFSNGFNDLSAWFKNIYCTNSFSDIDITENPIIKQFKIQLL
jgi:ribose-phosphate pyrophosphokinase